MSTLSSLAWSAQPRIPQCISASQLQPGDIICTASDTVTSRTIRAITNSRFSHTILYTGNGLAVDTTPDTDVSVDLLNNKLRDCIDVAVFRHRTASRAQREAAVQWAIAQTGKPYDKLSAARVGLDPDARTGKLRFTYAGVVITVTDAVINALASDGHDKSFFCSELVLRAFEVAGARIAPRPPHLTGPGVFLHNPALVYLGELAA